MLRFVKQIFVSEMMFFSSNILNVSSLERVSINNQECKVRPEIINISINERPFYSYSVKYINAVVFVKISMLHMQISVFLMLLKI